MRALSPFPHLESNFDFTSFFPNDTNVPVSTIIQEVRNFVPCVTCKSQVSANLTDSILRTLTNAWTRFNNSKYLCNRIRIRCIKWGAGNLESVTFGEKLLQTTFSALKPGIWFKVQGLLKNLPVSTEDHSCSFLRAPGVSSTAGVDK